jgi:hypothetical protein
VILVVAGEKQVLVICHGGKHSGGLAKELNEISLDQKLGFHAIHRGLLLGNVGGPTESDLNRAAAIIIFGTPAQLRRNIISIDNMPPNEILSRLRKHLADVIKHEKRIPILSFHRGAPVVSPYLPTRVLVSRLLKALEKGSSSQ